MVEHMVLIYQLCRCRLQFQLNNNTNTFLTEKTKPFSFFYSNSFFELWESSILARCALGAFWGSSSSQLMIFSDLIFLSFCWFSLLYIRLSSTTSFWNPTVFLFWSYPALPALGRREFKNLSTFGQRIVSTILTYPSSISWYFSSTSLKKLFYSSSAADDLAYSSTVRHKLTSLTISGEYLFGMGTYYPLVIFRYRPGKSLALNGTCKVQSS